MADPEQTRRDEVLIESASFRRTAFLLIEKMVELVEQASGDVIALLDEILHSIFFLGRLHNPPLSPESILCDGTMLNDLEDLFPQPFVLCSSQLPMRSPFSCVLDMIVHLNGRENEIQIMDGLRGLIGDPEPKQDLVPSTICVSHDVEDPVKYYGVSMTAPGSLPRKIMIAACCLSSWDGYVAGAVMTYFPTKKKNSNFDGTIQLPTNVRCQAFDLMTGSEKPPCRSCEDLFGLIASENDVWVYGNCAEIESLSNLFKNVDDVKESARPTSRMYTDEGRRVVEMRLRKDLTNWLRQREFTWNNTFYTPQGV